MPDIVSCRFDKSWPKTERATYSQAFLFGDSLVVFSIATRDFIDAY